MNSKKSSSLNLTRYLFALPILAITLAFTINKKDIRKNSESFKKIVNQVLPEKENETVSAAIPEKRINHKRKKTTSEVIKKDTLQRFTIVMHHISDDKDSLNKIIKIFMKKPVSGNDDESIGRKIKGTGFLSTFTFTDSVNNDGKSRIKNVTVIARIGADGKEIITRQYNTGFSIIGTGTVSKDSLQTPKPAGYFLNGKKISKEEMSKLQPDLISGILLNKDGWMDITSRQKK
jgi:hypothetical protein